MKIKKMVTTATVVGILTTLAIGTTVIAADNDAILTSYASNPVAATRLDYTENNRGSSFMQGRIRQYEAYLEEQVANGELTQEEANQYLEDYDNMAEYCNRVSGNENRQNGSGRFGCH